MAITTFTRDDFGSYDQFKFLVHACMISESLRDCIIFASVAVLSLNYKPLDKSGEDLDKIMDILDGDGFKFNLDFYEFESMIEIFMKGVL